MSFVGNDHCYMVIIAVFNTFRVSYRTPGLYYRRNSRIVSNLNAVGEREECIGCHNCPLKGESEIAGLLNRLFQGIYS